MQNSEVMFIAESLPSIWKHVFSALSKKKVYSLNGFPISSLHPQAFFPSQRVLKQQ